VFLVFGNPRMLSRYAGIRALAAARGLAVSCIAPAPRGAGRAAPGPDGILTVDLSDPTETLAAVLAMTGGRRVVAGVGLDEASIRAASLVLSLLGLPNPGVLAATISCNKLLQRAACPAQSPRWRLITPAGQTVGHDIPPPWVVKPVSRHSSSGVVLVETDAALRRLLASGDYGETEPILLEERICGWEYSVESLVAAGRLCQAHPTAKRVSEPPYFVEMGHVVPALGLSEPDEAALLATNAAVIRAIGVETALTHAEYRVTADGRVVLMEIAVRPPGDGLSLLYQAAYGVSLDEQLLALALGETPPPAVARRRALQRYLLPPGVGTFAGLTLPESVPEVLVVPRVTAWPSLRPLPPSAPPAVRMVLQHKSPGDRLGALRESDDRPASVVLDGPLDADLDRLAEDVVETLGVTVRADVG